MAKTLPPWLQKKAKGKGKDPGEAGENAKEEASETPAQERAEDKGETAPIKAVKNMVAAHSKVPPHKRARYRAAVVAKARKAGAMQHVPDSWLQGNKKG